MTAAPHHPAQVKGYEDAQRGLTANPYGTPSCRAAWDAGHDQAFEEGLTSFPRFGRLTKGHRR